MADFRLLFPNDYIGSADLRGKDVTKTIKAVIVEKLRMTGGKSEKKPVVLFSDTPKKLVLNKTNAKLIAGQHGNDTEQWIGKKITLYPTTTQFGLATVDCVRVREKSRVASETVPADIHPFEIDEGNEARDEIDAETGEVLNAGGGEA